MQKEKVVKISAELHKELKLIAVGQEKDLGKMVELVLSSWVKNFDKTSNNLNKNGQATA